MGQNHARVLGELTDYELLGFYDPLIKGESKYRQFEELRDLVEQVDAIVISSPTDLHLDHLNLCLDSGIHFLVEKPLAPDFKSIDQLFGSNDPLAKRVTVGMIERFNPAVAIIKDLVGGDLLGRPQAFIAQRKSPLPQKPGIHGVGLDLAIHDLDLMMWLLGEELEDCQSSKKDSGDFFSLVGKTQEGVAVNLHANWNSARKERNLEIYTSKAVIEIDLIQQCVEIQRKPGMQLDFSNISFPHRNEIDGRISLEVQKAEPLRAELQQFAKFIKSGQIGQLASVEDAASVLRIFDLAQ